MKPQKTTFFSSFRKKILSLSLALTLICGSFAVSAGERKDVSTYGNSTILTDVVDKSTTEEKTTPTLENNLGLSAFIGRSGSVVVSTEQQLMDTINSATDDIIITFDPAFPFSLTGQIVLDYNHNNNVVISGGGETFTAPTGNRHFTIDNLGTGTLVFKDMVLTAPNGGGGVIFPNGKGTALFDGVTFQTISYASIGLGASITVQNSHFKDITQSAITGVQQLTVDNIDVTNFNGAAIANNDKIKVSNSNFVGSTGGRGIAVKNTTIPAVIERCHFEGINGGITGISFTNNTKAEIKECSFVNNFGADPGYTGGAIGMHKNENIDVKIQNCYFKGNDFSHGGPTGGLGGGIAMYKTSGSVSISQCYFEANSAGLKGGGESTSDGGAISFKNNAVSDGHCSLTIDSCNFVGNKSYDDGAALFVEGKSKQTVTATVTNSTFYQNIAQNNGHPQWSWTADNGGAVQISQAPIITLEHNTFYENTNMQRDGGAIGYFGSGSQTTLINNLFLDNTAPTGNAKKQNVVLPYGAVIKGNIGIDNGNAIAAEHETLKVLGCPSMPLQTNCLNDYIAGNPNTPYTEDIKSIWVLPGGSDTLETISPTICTKDNRGYDRDSLHPTAGAIELVYVQVHETDVPFNSDLADIPYDKTTCLAKNDHFYLIAKNPDQPITVDDLVGTGKLFDPTTAGLELDHWEKEVNHTPGKVLYNPTTDTTLHTGHLDLYPVWKPKAVTHTVTFDTQCSLTAPANQTLVAGASIVEPSALNRPGYTFDGWFTAATGGIQWNFANDTMPANDITLYAQWTQIPVIPVTYSVTFDTQCSLTAPATQTLTAGSSIVDPGTLTRSGYTFNGWFAASTGGVKWNFANDTMPANNMTLYAQWTEDTQPPTPTPVTYTVTFDTQCDTPAPTAQTLKAGSLVSAPKAITRTNYTFNGWFTAATGGTKWDFANDKVPSHNITLYAQWTKDTATPPSKPNPPVKPTPPTEPTPPVNPVPPTLSGGGSSSDNDGGTLQADKNPKIYEKNNSIKYEGNPPKILGGKPGKKLPATGREVLTSFGALGGILALAGVAIIFRKKK